VNKDFGIAGASITLFYERSFRAGAINESYQSLIHFYK